MPIAPPNWDHNSALDRQHMADYHALLIQGIKEVVPHSQNVIKAFENLQEKDETPNAWLERLRKNLQQYSGIDPETLAGQVVLKVHFVSHAWSNIRKKLEKLNRWQNRELEDLLREAQKVYVVRDDEKAKTKAKVLVATIRESQKTVSSDSSKNLKGKPRKSGQNADNRPQRTVARVQPIECFYCKGKGHLKRNFLKRQKDLKLFEEAERD
ncbi:hypothetical protein BTVI_41890 [Pitangus sulphuratus]|nr:hypothetical protein BTVI_41890 [Pitangus sulphuratus]